MNLLFGFILSLTASGMPDHFTYANSGIVINEILFNPAREGYDYVELYNNGEDAVDLQQYQIAKRNATGDISGRSIAKTETVLLPHAYAVITANEKWLRQNYKTGE